MIRRIRDAFVRDDDAFATTLEELFVPPVVPHDPEIEATLEAARGGSDRHVVLTDLLGLKEIQDRLPDAAGFATRTSSRGRASPAAGIARGER